MAATDVAQTRPGPAGVLRRFPLIAYFLIALAFSWIVVAIWVSFGWPTTFWTIVCITLGPTVSSFIMTGVTQGWPGIRALLGRFVRWRVPFVWYVVALLGIPAVMVLGIVFLPGAATSFDPLTPQVWLGYPWTFLLVTFLGGPFLEEPGWRGFALARLEHKLGPLAGTLVLGLLWAVWHYPQYMMPEWAAQNGGFTLESVAIYTLSVIPITVIFTWVFNNTRGSLLLAILTHASVNTFSVYVGQVFPAQATGLLFGIVGFGGAALVVIALTRGRLGYDRYLSESASFERGTS